MSKAEIAKLIGFQVRLMALAMAELKFMEPDLAVLGIDPLRLILPCTLVASCAFMMPLGTPPKAIIFGIGLITVPRMCKTGFWLNLVAILVVTLLAMALTPTLAR